MSIDLSLVPWIAVLAGLITAAGGAIVLARTKNLPPNLPPIPIPFFLVWLVVVILAGLAMYHVGQQFGLASPMLNGWLIGLLSGVSMTAAFGLAIGPDAGPIVFGLSTAGVAANCLFSGHGEGAGLATYTLALGFTLTCFSIAPLLSLPPGDVADKATGVKAAACTELAIFFTGTIVAAILMGLNVGAVSDWSTVPIVIASGICLGWLAGAIIGKGTELYCPMIGGILATALASWLVAHSWLPLGLVALGFSAKVAFRFSETARLGMLWKIVAFLVLLGSTFLIGAGFMYGISLAIFGVWLTGGRQILSVSKSHRILIQLFCSVGIMLLTRPAVLHNVFPGYVFESTAGTNYWPYILLPVLMVLFGGWFKHMNTLKLACWTSLLPVPALLIAFIWGIHALFGFVMLLMVGQGASSGSFANDRSIALVPVTAYLMIIIVVIFLPVENHTIFPQGTINLATIAILTFAFCGYLLSIIFRDARRKPTI